MQVVVTPKALTHFKSLPKSEQTKVRKKIKLLEEDAFAGKKLSGALEELRSLRAWPHRIIYYLDKPQGKIYIVSILHRHQ